MQTLTVALLSIAAFEHSVTGAAVPRDVVHPRATVHLPWRNDTGIAPATDICTTCLTTTTTTSSSSTSTSNSTTLTTSTSTSAYSSTSISSIVVDNVTTGAESAGPARLGSQSIHDDYSSQGQRAQPNSLASAAFSNSSTDSPAEFQTLTIGTESSLGIPRNKVQPGPHAGHSWTNAAQYTIPKYCTSNNCSWVPSITSTRNATYPPGTLTVVPPKSSEPCIFPQGDEPVIEFSIVHTATVTFLGNRSDYTPPYPTIHTPNYCYMSSILPTWTRTKTSTPGMLPSDLVSAPADNFSGAEVVVTTKKLPCMTSHNCLENPNEPDEPENGGGDHKPPVWGQPTKTLAWGQPTETYRPKVSPTGTNGEITFARPRPTVTFVTTDKNPAVVFPSEPVPHFNRPSNAGEGFVTDNHRPISSNQAARKDMTAKLQANDGSDRATTSSTRSIAGPTETSDVDHVADQTTSHSGGRHDTAETVSSKSMDTADDSKTKEDFDQTDHSQANERTSKDTSTSQTSDDTKQPSQSQQRQSVHLIVTKTFTVTARGDEVLVNDKTYTGLKPEQITTVTVDQGTFTISPTIIVGEGATITKPKPVGTVISVAVPTSTVVGTVTVVVSGTEAVVGGTALKIPVVGTTTKVDEHPVVVEPGKIVVDDQIVTFSPVGGVPQIDIVVEGGEMVTVVGKSVYIFHSATLTYGAGRPETSEVVDDDTVTIAPSGIIIRDKTLGGSSASETDTKHEIVGGATITKVSPSYVVIDGTMFTAGPGAKRITKSIGGETVTIGPNGVVISTMTIDYPFGKSTVTTIKVSRTVVSDIPVETAATNNGKKQDTENGVGTESEDEVDEEDDSAGDIYRPSFVVGRTGFCIAIGVWLWI